MIVLGINEAHNSSCAIAIDGKIMAAAQEERFTRVKNQFGLPLQAIEFCLNFAKVEGKEIDLVVFSGGVPQFLTSVGRSFGHSSNTFGFKFLKFGKLAHQKIRQIILNTEYHIPKLRGIDETTIRPYYKLTQKLFFPQTAGILEQKFGIDKRKHTFLDHHTAHAMAALFSSSLPLKNQPVLVTTCDGGGDGLSATVSIFRQGHLKRIAYSGQDNSLGCLYGSVTDILGMNPLEHEYKVMGLAPYAEEVATRRVYDFLKSVIWLDRKNLAFKTIVCSDNLNRYLREHLPKFRFDHLAGAIQRLTEELLTDWIDEAMKRTGIGNVVFGGGVAQNVKANQKIAALEQVNNFFIMPSGGDESNAIGSAYWGCRKISPKITLYPLNNLYLGPSYTSEEAADAIKQANLGSKFKVSRLQNPELKIAKMLSEGKIVARFQGRMEFGARALGNRSILADCSRAEVVKIINHQIKSRDFWMPFAPTILKKDSLKYLKNPKNLQAPFMAITFDTKAQKRQDIVAAIHPFDYTLRPQILTPDANPKYYQLISYFKQITGRGAILNTSFNLHGEPIVCSPKDAISTLIRSGLKYLALEDYLIEKND